MTYFEEIEKIIKYRAAVDCYAIAADLFEMLREMRDLILTKCPCCGEEAECSEDCTFAEDAPDDFDEMQYKRHELKKIGVL